VAVRKVTVSLTEEAFDRALRAAKGANMSLSAWMSTALVDYVLIQEGLVAVADFEKEHGALPPDKLDAADRLLDELGVGHEVDPAEAAQWDAAIADLDRAMTTSESITPPGQVA
jgi:hypothetical protein